MRQFKVWTGWSVGATSTALKSNLKRHGGWLLLAAVIGGVFLLGAPTGASAAGSTFVVNTTDDTDDETCDATHCSLREAINAANATTDTDTIHFAISGTGPFIIRVGQLGSVGPALPNINYPVVIDGTTQFGSTCGDDGDGLARNLMIQIQPSPEYNGWQGLSLGGNSTLRGVAIGGFRGTPGSPGLYIWGGNNTIECSNFGTNGAGMVAVPNQVGMVIWGPNNTIGGSSSDKRNIVSGNFTAGISLGSVNGTANRIIGNYIGTDATGSHPLGNQGGIALSGARNNFIGSMTPGEGNVISGNLSLGITMGTGLAYPYLPPTDASQYQLNPDGNTVRGNLIGVVAAGGGALPNGRGINIQEGNNNQIVGNTIAHNDAGAGGFGWGIVIAPRYDNSTNPPTQLTPSPTGNRISQNSIFDNRPDGGGSGQGINANVAQNPPNLSSATFNGISTTAVAGNVGGAGGSSITIELFKNAVCDGSGRGEGQTYVGYITVPIPSGNTGASFAQSVPGLAAGDVLTATATAADGTTSTFSTCVTVGSLQPSVTYVVNDASDASHGSCGASCTLRDAIAAANSHRNIPGQPDRIEFNLGPGVHTIVLSNQLPSLTDPVVIDGLSQPNSQCTPTGLLVEIQGNSSLTGALQIDPGGDGSTIQGLAVGGFTRVDGRAVMVIRANNNTIRCNHFGTHGDGTLFQNAKGIAINDTSVPSNNNLFELNTIANHTVYGVTVSTPVGGPARVGNAFRRNSIYNNPGGGLGIPILGQPFVASTTAPDGGGYSSVVGNWGVLPPGTPVRFEFFASPTCDASLYGGGQLFLMATTVNADQSGVAQMGGVQGAGLPVGPIPAGWVITATATREDTHTTSGFSACRLPGFNLTSLTPSTIYGGSEPVVITGVGSGFQPGMKVRIRTNEQDVQVLSSVVVDSPTQFRVTVPASWVGTARTLILQGLYDSGAIASTAGPPLTVNALPVPHLSNLSSSALTTTAARDARIELDVSGFVGWETTQFTVSGGGSFDQAWFTVDGTNAHVSFVPFPSDSAPGPVPVGTYEIRATNPGPGGGTSNVLLLFVTEQPTAVTNVAVQTATTEVPVTASIGGGAPNETQVTATTSAGTGTVAVAEYAANPGDVPTFAVTGSQGGTFVDVYVSPGSTFSSATVEVCDANGGDALYWFDGNVWVAVGPPVATYNAQTGCITVVVTQTSVPSMADLAGAVFAVAKGFAPTVTQFAPQSGVIALGTAAVMNIGIADLDLPFDPHTWRIDWGDGTTPSTASFAAGAASAQGTHSYAAPGVYRTTVRVTDGDLAADEEFYQYIVVYDPSGGFVTGGGWIMSPLGAYSPDPSLTGKATFGFVSQYKKGASVPSGNTEFQFNAAGLNFKSTSYDWLVVSGSKAQFRGTGTINGQGHYDFSVSVIDSANGDRFRIRIWNRDGGGLVYDNQLNAPDTSDPTTLIGGGSIVVHK